METTITGANRIDRFESLSEIVEAACQDAESHITTRVSRNSGIWAGTDTFEEAIELATEGWEAGWEQMAGVIEQVIGHVQEVTDLGFARVWDQTGDEVDVPLFLAGEPECMLDTVLTPVATVGTVVRVGVDIGASANVTTDYLFRRGAAILALTEVLRILGHNTEIIAVHTVGNNRQSQHAIEVLVKSTQEMIDLNAIAFAIAHPAMQRRISFGFKETLPKEWTTRFDYGNGGGYSRSVRIDNREGRFDIAVPSPNSRRELGVEWIIEQLKAIGLEIKER